MSVDSIAFHVTDRCQLDCRHCLRDPGQKPSDLPVELVDSVLEQAARLYATPHAALTGGEPTLHPRFVDLVDAIVARGLTWHLVTNSLRIQWLLSQLDARPLRREHLTAIDLSLDGADEATHDAIRGKGTYRSVMTAATLCRERRIPFVLLMTVNALNAEQVDAVALLAGCLGAARVSFAMMQPTGTERDADLRLPLAKWRGLRDRIARLQAALTLPVSMPEGFHSEQPFHVCDALRSTQLHVDLRGRLTLCCQLSGIPGDGSEQDVAASLASTSLLEAHRKLLDIGYRAQLDKLQAIEAGPLQPAELFPCNWCLRHFGRPHWTSEGAAGPPARRRRKRTHAPSR